ncbi:MAG: GNAT family N-acetyltransferase [Rhodopila sp.]|jgi:GNAT superfamily N-acetyltransferase
MDIRQATLDDAASACHVLRRSIKELCVSDHGNDPTILRQWLANKTPNIVSSWIAKPGTAVLVAVERDTILGVGSVTNGGEITLNYVSPDARFRGISRALIGALEDRAMQWGNARCHLVSTVTARRFYRSAGYTDHGPPLSKFAMSSYPMSKALVQGSA